MSSPKTNHVDHISLQKPKYPSFSFIDYSNPNHNKTKTLSSTTNDSGKQKIIWFFSYSVNDVGKHSCDVCNKVFTSKKALNGHMICHSPTAAAPSSVAQSYDDHFLPPKKRRYMNIEDDVIAAESLLHISHGGFEGSTTNINVNHRGAKRQKLFCNMMDANNKKKKKEHDVLLTSDKGKIFQTSQDCKEPAASNHGIEEKKINEGETEIGSKVVKNFDLNKLPSDDVKNFDLIELPSDDVKNFDLNELPSDDVKNFNLNELPSDDVKNFDLNELPSDDFEDETN